MWNFNKSGKQFLEKLFLKPELSKEFKELVLNLDKLIKEVGSFDFIINKWDILSQMVTQNKIKIILQGATLSDNLIHTNHAAGHRRIDFTFEDIKEYIDNAKIFIELFEKGHKIKLDEKIKNINIKILEVIKKLRQEAYIKEHKIIKNHIKKLVKEIIKIKKSIIKYHTLKLKRYEEIKKDIKHIETLFKKVKNNNNYKDKIQETLSEVEYREFWVKFDKLNKNINKMSTKFDKETKKITENIERILFFENNEKKYFKNIKKD